MAGVYTSDPIHIVIDLCLIIAAHGTGGIEQSGKQVFLDVSHFGGVLVQTLKHILDMQTVDPEQLELYRGSRVGVTGNTECRFPGGKGFCHELHDFIQPLMVIWKVIFHDVIFDVPFDDLSVNIHPIHSHLIRYGIDRIGFDWIRIC